MNILAEKMKLMEIILHTQNEDLISKMKSLVNKEEKLPSYYLLDDELKNEFEASVKEADAGEIIPHEEAIKQLKRWPTK